jgi:SAM-dependent methyltransferase
MSPAQVQAVLQAIREELNEARAPILNHPAFEGFLGDVGRYLSLPGHEERFGLWPCLDDKTAVTPLDKYYFYQDTWAAGKILQIQPRQVVDVGSTALLVGVLSRIFPTTSVDVRPLPVTLQGLTCLQGSITQLPFADGSIELLSSMCVIEHIGLGRYGDPIDSQGSVKALKEVSRVVRPGGHFLFSVPLSHTPGVSFNAHRIFSKPQILGLLPEFSLVEELHLFPEPGEAAGVDKLEGFGFCVWCAHMTKTRVHGAET